MKRFLGAFLAAIAIPMSANAQTFTLPTQDQINQFLQAAQQVAAQTQTACPPVEIAPGISVPVLCANALPKAPPNAPTVDAIPMLAPPSIDLRGRDGPVKDQAQTGVCYAFALTTVMENELRRSGRNDVLSPLHVVASDGWSELWNPHSHEAITTENLWPYDPIKACKFETGSDSCERAYGVRTNSWRADPLLVVERERAKTAGVAFIGRARTFKKGDYASMVGALAQGRAIYASVDIDSNAWGFRGVRGGVLPEYERADRGGHAVAIVGYRTLGFERQFLLHNSWGRSWGENGYAWMSESSLRKHMIDAYLVDVTPKQPVVVQNPGSIQLCPSGWPPFMGQCWLG